MGGRGEKIPFRCYCCGEPLGSVFALVTMGDSTDRAFVTTVKHADRADDATVVVVRVERVKP